MHVSRPAVREALRALSLMNIVAIYPGDGTYVTAPTTDFVVEQLNFIFSLSELTIFQLFETRKIIEGGIVAIAAERITDEEIKQLDLCLEESVQVVDDPEAFMSSDIKLHELLTEAAKNPIASFMMSCIAKLGIASRRRTTHILGVPQTVLEHHKAIVLALKAHDQSAARRAMLTHLESVQRALEESIE